MTVKGQSTDARNEWGILIRDTYCTPEWFAELLPSVDIDPCSNPRSHVRARRRLMVENGDDGLIERWDGTAFLNIPYSDPDPWAEKLLREWRDNHLDDVGILCNIDSSTFWWRAFTSVCPHQLQLARRVPFEAPPGIDVIAAGRATAQRPQALLTTANFRARCHRRIDTHGTWWTREWRESDS